MRQERREQLTKIMQNAWAIARLGAEKFGGNAKMYMSVAMHFAWTDKESEKTQPLTMFRKNTGNQLWMDFVPMPKHTTPIGQLLLPGMVN